MIDDEVLQKLLKKALSRGGEYADVYIERRKTLSIQVEDDKIEKVIAGSSAGVGIRLIWGRKTAYAYSNDFDETVLGDLARTVSQAARQAERDVVINLAGGTPVKSFPVRVPPDNVAVPVKISIVMEANRRARAFDSLVRQVSVVYRDSVQDVKIATSEGSIVGDHRTYTTGIVHVIAIDGGVIQTGYESAGGHTGFELFEEFPFHEVAHRAAARAVMMLKARRAPGGRMPVVISSEAGGTMIHEAIGHGLEADLAQQGLSIYSGKMGKPVASPAITVIDDATLPNKRGSYACDDEGTPAGRTVLVRDGILTGYLYDRYTAMVDGTRSTGNGRRESYAHKPIPRMTNTFIEPGKDSPGDVMRSTDRGLLVRKMGGGQVDTVSGDFVFEVQEGYLIENGEAGEPVRGATLIGNGPEILQSIDMVGSDLGFSIGTCGKDSQGVPVSDAMPTLRIREIVVGGEVER
ncbi:MAG TPA: TldD/PmbA family protein [Dissulfurispiraceae bacterium]|nr:TldD/PmbA family protein [Dissulfurispiraceae bacterium]